MSSTFFVEFGVFLGFMIVEGFAGSDHFVDFTFSALTVSVFVNCRLFVLSIYTYGPFLFDKMKLVLFLMFFLLLRLWFIRIILVVCVCERDLLDC